jgi:hypothetical protein
MIIILTLINSQIILLNKVFDINLQIFSCLIGLILVELISLILVN